MKNSIVAGSIILFLVPQIALAAWWNPLSWFDSWSFIFGKKQDERVEVLEQKIAELENQLNDEPENENSTSTEEYIEEKEEQENIVDKESISNQARLNAEAEARQKEQDRLIAEAKAYEEEQKRLVEEAIARQKELDRIAKEEQELIEENNRLVEEYESEVYEIDKQILDLKKEYLKEYDYLSTNPEGRFAGALQADLDRLTQEYERKIQDLEFKKQDLYFEYKDKIDDLGF